MKREEFQWASKALERDVVVVRYGFYGRPVVWFPTSQGDHHEGERQGLVDALAPLINAGRIKLYHATSITQEAWYDPDLPAARRAALQTAWDQYVADDLLPFVKQDCNDTVQRLLVGGASFGAYNAINTACKRPAWFEAVIALSGVFDLGPWYKSDEPNLDYYFNSPLLYVPNLGDGAQLDALRRLTFHVATGRGRYEMPHESVRMARILAEKGIPNELVVEGPEAHHDWATWRRWLPGLLARFA